MSPSRSITGVRMRTVRPSLSVSVTGLMSLVGQPCQLPVFRALAGSELIGWSIRRKSGTAPPAVSVAILHPPLNVLRDLQALVGLAPAVAVNHVLQWSAAELAEIAHGPADRQDRVGMGAGRQAEDRVDLLAIAGMPRRQRRAEAERPRRQAHVLHRPIDRRAGRA